jgi:TRAP-type C4-dicarboxylate transport system permease small subunit
MSGASRRLERLTHGFELLAGAFLALVTALTFASVLLRYVFSWGLPDAFDIGRNLLGIVIFWGITLACYRGDHITVDLIWGALGPRARRVMDALATLLTLGCMAVFVWMMAGKVISTRADNVLTFDLHLPVWGFFLVAWLGLFAAVPLLLLRLYRILAAPAVSVEAANAPPTPDV